MASSEVSTEHGNLRCQPTQERNKENMKSSKEVVNKLREKREFNAGQSYPTLDCGFNLLRYDLCFFLNFYLVAHGLLMFVEWLQKCAQLIFVLVLLVTVSCQFSSIRETELWSELKSISVWIFLLLFRLLIRNLFGSSGLYGLKFVELFNADIYLCLTLRLTSIVALLITVLEFHLSVWEFG